MSNTASRTSSAFQCVLTVASGVDKGRTHALSRPGSYSIGRSKESHILIDESDKSASRSHAVITIEGGGARIDSLSQTNRTVVNKKAVQTKALKPGDCILIGTTEFTVGFQGGGSGASGKSSSKVKIISLFGIIVLLLFILVKVPKKSSSPESPEPSKVESVETKSSVEDFLSADPYLLEEERSTDVGVFDSVDRPSALPSANEEDADSHYRKAMFFYDARKLARAMDEIDLALMANPAHSSARKWLLRITDELNELIDSHYQNGLLNRKFMRYREAENDFQLVMELSRDKLDERYLDAQRQLEELEEL